MADSAVHTNWQRAGSTLHEEHQNITHLRPTGLSTAHRRPSDLRTAEAHLEQTGPASLSRHGGHGSAYGPTAQLSRRSSVRYATNLGRAGSLRLSPVARWRRFVKRFNWNQRSKAYAFGKAYLQRQPSFIVTPDRSSYAYSFKSRDLAKRKPKPRAWQTSQPVAVWKNPNPLDVLSNNGQVELPAFLRPGGDASQSAAADLVSNPLESAGSRPAGPSGTERPTAHASADLEAAAPGTVDADEQKKHLVKISLPVKHNRTSSNSNNDIVQHSTSTSTPGTTNTNRSSSSWLDAIPQTPVATAQRRRKNAGDSAGGAAGGHDPSPAKLSSKALQVSTEPTTPVPSSSRKPVRGEAFATPVGELSGAAAGAELASPPRARTSKDSLPQTPTSLPSNYRPESWRRSAIIARNASDPLAEETLYVDADSGFAGTWSAYLRRAVAQRAVESRERKSWEMRNEIRWSQNLEWESDSSSGSSSGRDDETASFDTSTESTSGNSFPSELSEYSSATRGSPTSSNRGSRHDLGAQAHEDQGSEQHSPSRSETDSGSRSERLPTPPEKFKTQDTLEPETPKQVGAARAQAVTGEAVTGEAASVQPLQMVSPKRHSLSKLAPLNSPREMASASASAIALARARSTASSVADSKSSFVTPAVLAPTTPGAKDPLASATSASPWSATGSAPHRGTSLFATGGSMQTPWTQESPRGSDSVSSGASIASSVAQPSPSSSPSDLDERETYVFPSQRGSGPIMATMITEDSSHDDIASAHIPSPRIPSPHTRSLSGFDFDFSDRGPSRKRQLPLSPLNTPPHSPDPQKVDVMAGSQNSADPLGTHKPTTSIESGRSGSSSVNTVIEPIEGAPAIVRSQSLWKKKQSGPKRVKSSSSHEFLVHTRQKTMESMWGGEDEDESDNAT